MKKCIMLVFILAVGMLNLNPHARTVGTTINETVQPCFRNVEKRRDIC